MFVIIFQNVYATSRSKDAKSQYAKLWNELAWGEIKWLYSTIQVSIGHSLKCQTKVFAESMAHDVLDKIMTYKLFCTSHSVRHLPFMISKMYLTLFIDGRFSALSLKNRSTKSKAFYYYFSFYHYFADIKMSSIFLN